jgi:hypothetical protein
VIDLLRSLVDSELPVRNIRSFVEEDLAQNEANEDRPDAIVSAYVAAYWWKFGAERSTTIGDLRDGYIVTPHSSRTYAALANVFDARFNQQGFACTPPEENIAFSQTAKLRIDRPAMASAARK